MYHIDRAFASFTMPGGGLSISVLLGGGGGGGGAFVRCPHH